MNPPGDIRGPPRETRVKLALREPVCTVRPSMNGSSGPVVGKMHRDPGETPLRVEQRGCAGKRAWIRQVLNPEGMRLGNLEWIWRHKGLCSYERRSPGRSPIQGREQYMGDLQERE